MRRSASFELDFVAGVLFLGFAESLGLGFVDLNLVGRAGGLVFHGRFGGNPTGRKIRAEAEREERYRTRTASRDSGNGRRRVFFIPVFRKGKGKPDERWIRGAREKPDATKRSLQASKRTACPFRWNVGPTAPFDRFHAVAKSGPRPFGARSKRRGIWNAGKKWRRCDRPPPTAFGETGISLA